MQSGNIQNGKGPPRPRASLRFGISGHRSLTDAPRIQGRIAELFRETMDMLQNLSAGHAELFDGTAAARLISPLAEGADRIAAEAALANGFALDCPLPFTRELYEADFAAEDSRKTFRDLLARARNVFELEDRRGENDNRAYEAVGLMTLRQCDILIAVWNGKPAEGRGGTAEIVSHAIESNIPIIWVHSEDDVPPRLLRPPPAGGHDPTEAPYDELSSSVLSDLLAAMVLPAADPQRHVSRPPSRRLKDYWRETQRRFTFTVFYGLMQGLMFVRTPRLSDFAVPDYLASAHKQWNDYWRLLPPVSALARANLETILEPAFGWADGLASYYVRLYRSSYVVSFFLASGAVFVSLLGLWGLVDHRILFAVELAVMLTILAIVGTATIYGWHDRWIDYRHLAEQLRHMRLLALTGSSTLEIRQTAHTDEAAADSGAAWVGWYYRAIVREIGMVGARADAEYARAVAQLVQRTELAEQQHYHEVTGDVSHKLDRRLHIAGIVVFSLAASVCLAFLLNYWNATHIEETRAHLEIFLTSLLPSFGAALYSIRVQGEFGQVARRARQMHKQLAQISKALDDDAAKGTLTLASVSALTEMAARAMVLDVTDWRFVFRDKPLNLPA